MTIVGLLVLSTILIKNLRKQKDLIAKLDHFNLLRKTYIDADHSLIQLKDENLKYIFVNKAFEELYQMPSSAIIGKDDFELVDEECAYAGRRTDLAALKKMEVIHDKIMWGEKVLQTTKFPVKLPKGSYGVGAYIRDITEDYQNRNKILQTMEALRQSESKIQLVLDSVPEGIFGINKKGICTFCNKSALKLLGYDNQEQLLGRNMHWTIHHSRKDGSTIAIEECRILATLIDGKGAHVDDEVFWRADGSSFEVEYYSFPEWDRDNINGLIVSFWDITKRKEAEREILYNSYHDAMTGLYNRRYYEEELEKLDIESNMPISIIIGDVNGLKQTNDIFGHKAGDLLITTVAEIIKNNCRPNDIAIRSGGDEFLIILPRTSRDVAKKMADQIKKKFYEVEVRSLRGSISLGVSTKTSSEENIIHTIDKADSAMYSQKTLDQVNFNKNAIEAIMTRLFEMAPWEKNHALRMVNLCRVVGEAMNLSSSELRRLEDSAYYHDIGKIILYTEEHNKKNMPGHQERQIMKRHSVVGYRILNLSDKTLDIAKYVLSHHERWDGKGYPNQLQGQAIPKISRILSLIDSYDRMIHGNAHKKPLSKEEAIREIRQNAGKQFDPDIAERFVEIVSKL